MPSETLEPLEGSPTRLLASNFLCALLRLQHSTRVSERQLSSSGDVSIVEYSWRAVEMRGTSTHAPVRCGALALGAL